MYFGEGKDFYEELAFLFTGSDWINHITEKIISKENKRMAEAQKEGTVFEPTPNLIPAEDDYRTFAKKAFMFAVNGGDSFLIRLIEQKAPFTAVILRLISISELTFLKKELAQDLSFKKEYKPYKNMAALLQRTESFLIQRAYIKSNTWGHLIHDSILCIKDNAELVEKNIKTVYLDYLGVLPKVTIK